MAESPAGVDGSPRARGSRRWTRWATALLAVILAWVVAADIYVVRGTRGRIVGSVEEAPARSAALVLGNRVLSGVPSIELAERLQVALGLYRAGRVRRVIVSGAFYPPEYDEPEAMAGWLVRRGVPREAITLDRLGHRTAASIATLVQLGVRDPLICTQDYHLPRALYLARSAGLDALGIPARQTPGEGLEPRFRMFLRESLARAEAVIEVHLRGVHY